MSKEKIPVSLELIHQELKAMRKESKKQYLGSILFAAYCLTAAIGFVGISFLIPLSSEGSNLLNGYGLIAIALVAAFLIWSRFSKLHKE